MKKKAFEANALNKNAHTVTEASLENDESSVNGPNENAFARKNQKVYASQTRKDAKYICAKTGKTTTEASQSYVINVIAEEGSQNKTQTQRPIGLKQVTHVMSDTTSENEWTSARNSLQGVSATKKK